MNKERNSAVNLARIRRFQFARLGISARNVVCVDETGLIPENTARTRGYGKKARPGRAAGGVANRARDVGLGAAPLRCGAAAPSRCKAARPPLRLPLRRRGRPGG